MIMPIYLYGTRVWDGTVRKIDTFDEKLVGIIRNMFETLRSADGVGLSATQVGFRISLFVMDISEMEGYADEQPLVVINPEILSSSEETKTLEEGCLSVPGICLEVTRPESIIVRFTDGNFQTVECEYSVALARVFQHEFDHLHQKFITDRVSALKRHILKPNLSKIKRGEIITRYPVISPPDEKVMRRPEVFDYAK
ncbi:MAG TPA: peptide deformylase [Candidatus Kryptonia bacterium]